MLVRVFEIPPPTGNFHFGGGEPQMFLEVDWFRDDIGMLKTEAGIAACIEFIKLKNYFNPHLAYLVLTQDVSFTIGYSAP